MNRYSFMNENLEDMLFELWALKERVRRDRKEAFSEEDFLKII